MLQSQITACSSVSRSELRAKSRFAVAIWWVRPEPIPDAIPSSMRTSASAMVTFAIGSPNSATVLARS
jgi:hypothetical protein